MEGKSLSSLLHQVNLKGSTDQKSPLCVTTDERHLGYPTNTHDNRPAPQREAEKLCDVSEESLLGHCWWKRPPRRNVAAALGRQVSGDGV